MLSLSIVTPNGVNFEGEIDYAIVSGNNGQFGILANHVPIIAPIDFGFIKRVINNESAVCVISGGVLEFSNGRITVIAQEVATAPSVEAAFDKLSEIRQTIKEENRKKLIDFAQMERELALNLKEIKASQL